MKKKGIILLLTLLLITITLCACNRECKHELSKTARTEATCTENGNIEFWTCSQCNKIFSDQTAAEEITDVEIIANGHKYGDYSYDYENKSYSSECEKCDDIDTVIAGNESFPLLARNEIELSDVVKNAEPQNYIKLVNDITVTTGEYEVVLRIPDGGTLDLDGHTVTVKINGSFLVEGTNVTLQNGKVATDFEEPDTGYALFVGDNGENNNVTLKNLQTSGGINVYNCDATLYDCNVDASQHTYYALWADVAATVTVESGEYFGGKTACVHSTSNTDPELVGNVVINGGSFCGKIYATHTTTINGGEFDSDIVLIYYKRHAKLVVHKDMVSQLNVTADLTKYEIITTVDSDGNVLYETKLKEDNI